MFRRKTNLAPLKLTAFDEEGLKIISSLTQDAIVRIADMYFDQTANRFVLIINRYRWERKSWWMVKGTRVKSALTINTVQSVKSRNVDQKNSDNLYNLLTINCENDQTMRLVFAAGGEIELNIEAIDLVLSDLSDDWDAIKTPKHPV